MSDTAGAAATHREVGFGEAIQLFFKNFAKFQGRSSRGAFWWIFLFNFIIGFITGFIDALAFSGAVEGGISPLNMLYSLAVLIPGVALSVRRLHDVGKSGWWLLIGLTGIGLLLLLYWYVQPGQREENKFGPDVEAGKA